MLLLRWEGRPRRKSGITVTPFSTPWGSKTRNIPRPAGTGRLDKGIEKERMKLAFLKKDADFIIDTSQLLTRELRQELEKIFLKDQD